VPRSDGAVADLVGDVDRGCIQIMEQVNLSRRSHGVRAAAMMMMRRCLNAAMVVTQDPLALGDSDWEQETMDLLLQDKPAPLAKAVSLVG
jgi:hypothetical protein